MMKCGGVPKKACWPVIAQCYLIILYRIVLSFFGMCKHNHEVGPSFMPVGLHNAVNSSPIGVFSAFSCLH